MACFRIEEVKKRERDVKRILFKRGSRGAASLFRRLGLGRPARKVTQRLQSPFCFNPLGRLGDHRKHSSYTARFISNRTVGERKVAVLQVAVSVKRYQYVVERDRFAVS